MSKHNAQRYHSQQYNSQKTSILAVLRDEAGLTQPEAGEYFGFSGEKRRDTIGGWERGETAPSRKHRKRFIAYLWIELGLRHNRERFWKLWDDVPVGEWGWSPLTNEELLDSIRRAMLFLAPFLPSHALVGREDLLNQLKQQLLGGNNVALCALHGLPGVGKTALAVALAHDHDIQEHFADGVLWAGLGRSADVLAVLTAWGSALRIQASELANLTTVAEKVGRIRAAIGMRQMLLVIDDAWTDEAALAFRLGGPNCAHLLTTRQPDIAQKFAHEGTQFVHELNDADGFRLLQLLAPEVIKNDPEAARELVRSVGGLPLGLVLIGNYLKSQPQTDQSRHLREALQKLRQSQMRLKLAVPQPPAERYPSLPEGASISLEAIIGITYDGLDRATRGTLRALSILPAKPNTFSEEAGGAIARQPVEILNRLNAYGLLETSSLDRYTLHQTIADYGRTKRIAKVTYERMVKYFVQFVENHQRDYNALAVDFTNILAAFQTALDRDMRIELVRMANAICRFLESRGLYELAESHLKQALEAARFLEDPAGTAAILANLGRIAIDRGNYTQAAAYNREGLSLVDRLESPSIKASLLQGLGLAYDHQGDYQRAEDLYRRSLLIARQVDDRERIATLLRSLGAVLYDLGQYDDAEKCWEEGLAISRATGQFENLTPLLVNLAGVAAAHGDFVREDRLYQEALTAATKIGHQENLLYALSNYGASLRDHGNVSPAELCFQQGLEVARKIAHRERMSALLRNLGEVETDRGNWERAEAYLREGLAIAEEIKHTRNTSALLAALGALETARGKLEEAETYLHRAWTLAREIRNTWHTSDALVKRGNLHLRRDNLGLAEQDFRNALDLATDADIKELVADAVFGLARLAALEGDFAEAHHKGRESLAIFESIGYSKSTDVKNWLATLPPTAPRE